ncbi:MAG: DinB family protein [Gemmatimonadota bacterium]
MGEPHLDVATAVVSLRRNAAVLADLVRDVSAEQARWKPEPTQWSILEVVTHLADEEVEDFRARVDSTLHRPEAEWSPIDPEGWAVERRYNEGSLDASLHRFLTARAESIAWLQGLAGADWATAHEHPSLGPIRAGDLLTSWVAHDHIHIRQVNRLQRDFLVATTAGFSPRYAGRW